MGIKGTCFRVGIWCFRGLQRLVRASTVGVRVLVVDENQRILLVKHTYVPGWHFPGGGVDPGESPVFAATRELREETGVIAEEEPQLFGIYYQKIYGVNDYPILYIIQKFSQQKPSRCSEIAEISWFTLDQLPSDITPSTGYRLEEFFKNKSLSSFW